jgi:Xaa-Pro dipeptidase
MSPIEEMKIKCERLRKYSFQNQIGAYLITCQSNFAWLTGGRDVHLLLGNDAASANLLITKEDIFVITSNNESLRIKEEVINGLGIKSLEYPWYRPDEQLSVINELAGGQNIATDGGVKGFLYLPLTPIQHPLLDIEIERYKLIGKDAADGMFNVGKKIRRGQSEHEIAASISYELLVRGIVPVVILVAADSRISKYKHPISTNNKVDNYVMIVACGQKYGLFVSITRYIHFGTPPDVILSQHKAVNRIAAVSMLNSKAGVKVADVFNKICRAYSEAGYPDEWKRHHQGGPIGYLMREYLATAESDDLINTPQAFAWNPSIKGTKSEDTFIAQKGEPIVVTAPFNWPSIDIEVEGSKINFSDILVRKENT